MGDSLWKRVHMQGFLDFIHSGLILKGSIEQWLKAQTPELDSEDKSQPFPILLREPGQITCPLQASVSSFVDEGNNPCFRWMWGLHELTWGECLELNVSQFALFAIRPQTARP